MSINKKGNYKYNGLIPEIGGDIHRGQDMIRDHWFNQDRIGKVLKDLGETIPIIISGGIVTKGTGDTLNITSLIGYHKYQIEIPDSFASVPPTKINADIEAIRVESTQQTNMIISSATLNGSAVNYVKIKYIETNGNTRQRSKKVGIYSYEVIPSFQIVVDTVVPTDYEVCLCSFIGTAGGSFTFGELNISNILDKNQYTKWANGEIVGSVLAISNATGIDACELTHDTVAGNWSMSGSPYTNYLVAYKFNGITWVAIGTNLNTGLSNSYSQLVKINNTDIACLWSAGIRTYRFNGSTWSQIGTTLVLTGLSNSIYNRAVKVSKNKYAFFTAVNLSLRTFDWDGSTWIENGNPFSFSGLIPVSSATSIKYLTDNIIVLVNGVKLITLKFDGVNWLIIGNQTLDVSVDYGNGIIKLNDTDIIIIDGFSNKIVVFRYKRNYWYKIIDWHTPLGTLYLSEHMHCGLLYGGLFFAIDADAYRLGTYRLTTC